MDELFVNKLVGIQQQLRILHWQTKSYAKHKAYGETYDGLSDLIDSFMEEFMGKYGRFHLTMPSIQVINVEDLDVEDFIEGSILFLTSFTEQLEPTDTNLLNIRDEMLGSLNKLKYLLTLK
jgi:hypothetical protein